MRKYNNFEYKIPLIKDKIEDDLKVIIVIPSFYEKNLINTIDSLLSNKFDNGSVEVIIVINESESVNEFISDFHKKQFDDIKTLSQNISTKKLKFYPVYIKNIDNSVAGPGIARKIGMDEAVKRFDKINNQYGLIVNLDGDTIVRSDYLDKLLKTSIENHKIKAYSIYFEHNLNEDIPIKEREAIIQYELHLRYYINMQRLLNLPFAYYTIGSAMAVRNFAYKEAFGMNKRQAGEDFYFLHKFIKTGYFGEINNTKVYPSARISNRVPFGTGKAISKMIESGKILQTYNYKSFDSLSSLIDNLEKIYHNYDEIQLTDKPIREFLYSRNFSKRYLEIKTHTKDYTSFKKRFFRWFDAFLLMKYLHFARDNYFPNIDISYAIEILNERMKLQKNTDLESSLKAIREVDKKATLLKIMNNVA